jgi:hypothetical protein
VGRIFNPSVAEPDGLEIRPTKKATRGHGMLDGHDLAALLNAYTSGDTLARKALLDALEEAGDPRADAVRAERVDWDAVARRLRPARDTAYHRWLIDCARVGSATRPDVVAAVRRARRDWLRRLFPEVDLAE